MVLRSRASMLAFITGIPSQAITAPRHQSPGPRPRARSRFSVLMASSRQLQITRTRLRGRGSRDTATLPTRFAAPQQAFTVGDGLEALAPAQPLGRMLDALEAAVGQQLSAETGNGVE